MALQQCRYGRPHSLPTDAMGDEERARRDALLSKLLRYGISNADAIEYAIFTTHLV